MYFKIDPQLGSHCPQNLCPFKAASLFSCIHFLRRLPSVFPTSSSGHSQRCGGLNGRPWLAGAREPGSCPGRLQGHRVRAREILTLRPARRPSASTALTSEARRSV